LEKKEKKKKKNKKRGKKEKKPKPASLFPSGFNQTLMPDGSDFQFDSGERKQGMRKRGRKERGKFFRFRLVEILARLCKLHWIFRRVEGDFQGRKEKYTIRIIPFLHAYLNDGKGKGRERGKKGGEGKGKKKTNGGSSLLITLTNSLSGKKEGEKNQKRVRKG